MRSRKEPDVASTVTWAPYGAAEERAAGKSVACGSLGRAYRILKLETPLIVILTGRSFCFAGERTVPERCLDGRRRQRPLWGGVGLRCGLALHATRCPHVRVPCAGSPRHERGNPFSVDERPQGVAHLSTRTRCPLR